MHTMVSIYSESALYRLGWGIGGVDSFEKYLSATRRNSTYVGDVLIESRTSYPDTARYGHDLVIWRIWEWIAGIVENPPRAPSGL